MYHPMDAVIFGYQFIMYTLFLTFFPWGFTRGICYDRKGNPKYSRRVVTAVYVYHFLVWLLVCSFITTVSKDINLENISAGDKMWIYVKLTLGNADYVSIGEPHTKQITERTICFTKENADEIDEEFLNRIMENNAMFVRIYHLEGYEIKPTEHGWYIMVDNEYMATIFIKEGLFLTEIQYFWNGEKLEEREERNSVKHLSLYTC